MYLIVTSTHFVLSSERSFVASLLGNGSHLCATYTTGWPTYVFLDGIGAMGETGYGVVEYWGVDPADVDIMIVPSYKALELVAATLQLIM